MMKRSVLALLASFALLLGGCVKDYSEDYTPGNGKARHTLFIYMAADNNLAPEAQTNLDALLSGVTRGMLAGNRVIVYYAKPSVEPRLLELVYDRKIGKNVYRVLKEYKGGCAAETEDYVRAMDDMFAAAPADSYGLVLWSHATGWLPKEAMTMGYQQLDPTLRSASVADCGFVRDPYRDIEVLTKVFAQDEGTHWMELADLAEATPDGVFDYIVADCCLMGQVEVAYALRDKARYIVASPAEILSNGMPYGRIVSDLLSGGDLVARLKNVCYKFYDYYNRLSGTRSSATIALYDCSQLGYLADAASLAMGGVKGMIPTMPTEGIQVYDRFTKHTNYDIAGIVGALLPEDDPAYMAFMQQLGRTVIYKETTGRMMGLEIDKEKYSGMGMYIPKEGYADLNAYYYATDWAQRIFPSGIE